jgi:ABC-type branched-subunit amino acid transport system ATPase component
MNFGRKIAEGSPANVRFDPEVIRCYLGTGRQNVTEVAPC